MQLEQLRCGRTELLLLLLRIWSPTQITKTTIKRWYDFLAKNMKPLLLNLRKHREPQKLKDPSPWFSFWFPHYTLSVHCTKAACPDKYCDTSYVRSMRTVFEKLLKRERTWVPKITSHLHLLINNSWHSCSHVASDCRFGTNLSINFRGNCTGVNTSRDRNVNKQFVAV